MPFFRQMWRRDAGWAKRKKLKHRNGETGKRPDWLGWLDETVWERCRDECDPLSGRARVFIPKRRRTPPSPSLAHWSIAVVFTPISLSFYYYYYFFSLTIAATTAVTVSTIASQYNRFCCVWGFLIFFIIIIITAAAVSLIQDDYIYIHIHHAV